LYLNRINWCKKSAVSLLHVSTCLLKEFIVMEANGCEITTVGRVVHNLPALAVAYPGILFGGGGSTNSVEDRENEDLWAVAP
jgi:hypothetical protein